MDPQHPLRNPTLEPDPKLPNIKIHHPASPRHHSPATPVATPTPTAGARRKVGVAVDLSGESAYAVQWAVQHYIRPGDAVILLHVSPTSVLFGADWGAIDISLDVPGDNPGDVDAANSENGQHQNRTERSKRKLEDDFDAFTASKAADIAKSLKDAQIPYKIHIVKDHDMRERLCLEVERLGLNALIMGSRGFGAAKRGNDGGLGSVSDYCVHHCVCPVVVVRFPDEKDDGIGSGSSVATPKGDDGARKKSAAEEVESKATYSCQMICLPCHFTLTNNGLFCIVGMKSTVHLNKLNACKFKASILYFYYLELDEDLQSPIYVERAIDQQNETKEIKSSFWLGHVP